MNKKNETGKSGYLRLRRIGATVIAAGILFGAPAALIAPGVANAAPAGCRLGSCY